MNLEAVAGVRLRAGAGRDPRRGGIRPDCRRARRRATRAAARRHRARLRERLAYFKVPGHIAFVDAIPVTPTQKLQRGAIQALARRRSARPTRSTCALQGDLRQREKASA